jgi:hypothetical protein
MQGRDHRRTCEDNFKMPLKGMGYEKMGFVHVTENGVHLLTMAVQKLTFSLEKKRCGISRLICGYRSASQAGIFSIARSEVITAPSMKMAVFAVFVMYSLVEVCRRSRGACCLHHQGNRNELLPHYTEQQTRRHRCSFPALSYIVYVLTSGLLS